MGIWRWEGVDKNGKRVRGQLKVSSDRDVRKVLRAQGIKPRRITPPSILEFDISEWMVEKGLAKSFGHAELSNFTKQLSIMVNAGVPILQSLEILYKSEKNPSLKAAVKAIAASVGEGQTISEAMGQQKGFDRLYCSLVRAGEAGGILDQILTKLNEHMDRQAKIRAKVKSALTYPVIVSIIGTGVCWGMMVFVVPQFQDMLNSTGQETPAITQLVIDVSNFLQKWTLYLLPVVFVGLVLLNAFTKSTTGKPVFDRFMTKVPLFGQLVIKSNLASFSRTLATMLAAGVSLIDALDICVETIDNSVIANDIRGIKKAVMEGKTFNEPIEKIYYFPDMVAQMIKVGEQTGNLDQMLLKIADVFEDQVNEIIDNLTKMIEPLIIVVLGGFVAAILVAMYLPIFMSAGGS